MSALTDTASPPVNNGSSSSASSPHNFFATKNLFKLFSKKSKAEKKTTSSRHIPFFKANSPFSNTDQIELVLKRSSNTVDYGFTIIGYCPCHVGKVEHDSVAHKSGLLVGDLIIKVNSNNVQRATSESIVKMIKNSAEQIKLSVLRNAKAQQTSTTSSSTSNSMIPLNKLISQGDQAATCIINSTENDFFLSKTNEASSSSNTARRSASNSVLNDMILNQQAQFTKFLKTTPVESFKSDDFIYYAGGSGVSINYHKEQAKRTESRSKLHHRKTQRRSRQSDLDEESEALSGEDLPSPIPYLPPLNKKKRKQKQQDIEAAAEYNLQLNAVKKSTLTDSDYKTQSSSTTTDIASSSNEYQRQQNQQQKINDFELEENDNDEFDSERMDACEQLLHLEEKFIEKMQKGVQQYSRPLRHCMMINTNQHYMLFQNIEKILAISEYQLNQLISQDDSTLISMFNSIGKLYENKMRMSCEAFDIYLDGIDTAFQLLNNLMRMPNFANFIQDSMEDINMDLKAFLLLPLTYVQNVWECLNVIKSRTNKTSCDYMPISTVIQSLDVYVQKSKLNFNKYSIVINDDKSSALSGANAGKNHVEEQQQDSNADSDDEDDQQADYTDVNKLNPRFLLHSSKLNYRLLKKNKWNKIHALLFKDALAFMTKDFHEKMLNDKSYLNCVSTIIQLKDVVKYDFDSDKNEFQLIYTNSSNYYSISLKAPTLDEKNKWKKLLNHCIQQSKRK